MTAGSSNVLRRRSRSFGQDLDCRMHDFRRKFFTHAITCCVCKSNISLEYGKKCQECKRYCHTSCEVNAPIPCSPPILNPIGCKSGGTIVCIHFLCMLNVFFYRSKFCFFRCSIDWFLDWLFVRLVVWFVRWLTVWLIDWSKADGTVRLIDWFYLFFSRLQFELEKCSSAVRPRIPAVVSQCIRYIQKQGLNEEGLYRVCGSKTDIEKLKKQYYAAYRKNPQIASIPDLVSDICKIIRAWEEWLMFFLNKLCCFTQDRVRDVHVVCGFLTNFLMSLKEPLLTYALWSRFATASCKSMFFFAVYIRPTQEDTRSFSNKKKLSFWFPGSYSDGSIDWLILTLQFFGSDFSRFSTILTFFLRRTTTVMSVKNIELSISSREELTIFRPFSFVNQQRILPPDGPAAGAESRHPCVFNDSLLEVTILLW